MAAEMVGFRKLSIFAEILRIMGILPRWEQKLQSYHKALNRLAEVVNEMKKLSNEAQNDLFSQF